MLWSLVVPQRPALKRRITAAKLRNENEVFVQPRTPALKAGVYPNVLPGSRAGKKNLTARARKKNKEKYVGPPRFFFPYSCHKGHKKDVKRTKMSVKV
jgi:hypothetical protein